MKLAFLLLFASLGWAQVPTISNITVTNVTHNSVTLRFASSSNTAWVSCLLGTVSGTYTAQTCPNYQVGNTIASFSLGGLAPSTTYYIRPTAQPDQTDQTNICNADGCGATEQTFVTSADPALPVVPTAPTAYNPPNPDTSAYIVVRMVAGTAGGECKAFASVGTVTAGDTVQTVLNEITLGYVLELDQGITCPVPNTNGGNSGYFLPPITTGTGYVVMRTKAINASDFPPFGTRTSPTLCAKCAIFKSTQQFTGGAMSRGQIFQSTTGGAQHYIIQNLWLTVDQTISSPSGNCGGSHSCWGELINLGNGTSGGDPSSDDNTFDRVVVRGSCNAAVDTYRAFSISAHKTAIVNSWIDCIWGSQTFAQGIFLDPAGTGPYTIDNNYIQCICMTIYQEVDSPDYANPANDISVTHNTLYWPLANINSGYLARQQVEFKGGHRILVQGNLIDGCWVYQNECPAVYVAGTNNEISGDGVSDVNVNYNLIRNAATVFDCRGIPTSDGGQPGPSPNISQRIWLQNNWAYNLGYQFIGASAGGGGAVTSYIVQRPGCTDFTVTQNTLGFTNPHDTRAGAAGSYIPAIYELGGGVSLAANFTHTNNVLYMNATGGSYNGGRIVADFPQTNPSYPITPAYTYNNSGATNAPSAILNSYSVHTTNGSTVPSVTWSGNVNICGQEDRGANTWSDMTSAECTTWQRGMPSGDTWATGSTIAGREASVGFDPTTGICSGCNGAGTNIATLYQTMNVVTGISVSKTSTSATFNYTAPDTRACDVDTSPDGTTWTRTVDAGGSSFRVTTVTGLGAGTLYYRILCYFSQTAPLFFGSQITDGILGTGAAFSPCDLNMDGVTNVIDVQLIVNMSLGMIPCTANITAPGQCSVVQVQRVVNASLGGACVTGP